MYLQVYTPETQVHEVKDDSTDDEEETDEDVAVVEEPSSSRDGLEPSSRDPLDVLAELLGPENIEEAVKEEVDPVEQDLIAQVEIQS